MDQLSESGALEADRPLPSTPTSDIGPAPRPVRLVALSFLMLFLELALIRWLGENVLYLSYFSNFVLLASFLGIGLGFLGDRARSDWFRWLPYTLLGLVGFVLVFPVQVNRSATDVLYFGVQAATGLPIWVTLPVLFAAVVAIMAMVGQAVARVFGRFPALNAYRLDVMGSILGIAVFTLLSFLRSPPVVWALVVAAMVWILAGRRMKGPHAVALGGLVVVLGAQSIAPNLSWSPYYKVGVLNEGSVTQISVNGVPHQSIMAADLRREATPIYFAPYQLLGGNPVGRVLIIGAGNGSDVAIALEEGATHVDAVEIDPRIYELGVQLNPDQPYADPRVAVHIDDGRAFMERASGPYDLILFALPDSLTLVSGQANLRLESYLFTKEAIERARSLLAPNGTFAMYNYYRQDWLVGRLGRTLQDVFGGAPCAVSVGTVGKLALLAEGPAVAESCPAGGQIDTAAAPPPVTDDYPFLYVRERGIPNLYLIVLGAILLVSILAVRVSVRGIGSIRPYLDLFAMGAAFLLLETKSVVQFALWFGTTWVVNSLVFTGVLVAVLAAIEVARRVRLPRPIILYGLLVAALLGAWLVPPHALLEMSPALRWVAATALTFTPVFLANLVFAQRFEQTASATAAFGANLLGAMLGGVLEYLSLVVGYRALLFLVGALYIGAYLLWRMRKVPASA